MGAGTRSGAGRAAAAGGVHFLEVGDDSFHRGAQAVEVQAVEAHAALAAGASRSLCARSQPTKSSTSALRHIQVGNLLKAAQRLLGVGVIAGALHVAADAIGVGPVTLDRHGGEPELLDQPARDPRALAVELVGAVACLAEQHEARIADPLEQRVVVAVGAVQRLGIEPQRVERRGFTEGQGQRRSHAHLTPCSASSERPAVCARARFLGARCRGCLVPAGLGEQRFDLLVGDG